MLRDAAGTEPVFRARTPGNRIGRTALAITAVLVAAAVGLSGCKSNSGSGSPGKGGGSPGVSKPAKSSGGGGWA